MVSLYFLSLFFQNEERQRFEEVPVEEFFPEFIDLPSKFVFAICSIVALSCILELNNPIFEL